MQHTAKTFSKYFSHPAITAGQPHNSTSGTACCALRHNGFVGKHSAPARARDRGKKRPARLPRIALGLGLGAVFAWCVLVWFAIRLGPEARAGDGTALALAITATLGAVACLFLGLLQGMRVWSALKTVPAPANPEPPRPVGGRRAKR